jgi:predicted DNA-binding transcriptional regulator AlpA
MKEHEMTRKALRKPAVLAATGWSNSTLYEKIAAGKFPKASKLDPEGRIVIWWEDEVEAFQKAAAERQRAA